VRHIRDRWRGHLIVKGLLHVEDAVIASDCGVNGVVLSNHGARQIDTTVCPLEILPAVRQRLPNMTILIDSRFRSGGDVLKAIAFGADLVLLGRPMLRACAVSGRQGVEHAIDLLHADIDRELAILGQPSLQDLNPDFLF